MSEMNSTPLFGDVLARARERWIGAMARRLAERGYDDYRRSDALAVRLLVGGPRPLAAFQTTLGASRQAARKVVTGLVERGFASLETDPNDARRRTVRLTTSGEAYASDVIDVLRALNRDLAAKVDPEALRTAISVLSFVIDDLLI